VRHDYVRCQAYQLSRIRPHETCVVSNPAKLDAYVATLDPSNLTKSLPESRNASVRFRVSLDRAHQYADPSFTRLLRARRERPRRHAAQQRDEIPSLQPSPAMTTDSTGPGTALGCPRP
jgi:hypothetical protein